jgi:hypothetical protein
MIIEDESIEDILEPLFDMETTTKITRGLPFETLVAGIEQLENIEQHYN